MERELHFYKTATPPPCFDKYPDISKAETSMELDENSCILSASMLKQMSI